MRVRGEEYSFATVGNCLGTGAWIESKVECEVAARRLVGWHAAASDSKANTPHGCYWEVSSQRLYWSLAGSKEDNDRDTQSICARGAWSCATSPVSRKSSHSHNHLLAKSDHDVSDSSKRFRLGP